MTGRPAVLAVATTGICCDPSCAARPHPEHVTALPSAAAAEAAGYRPCRRCRPGEDGAGPADGGPARVTVPLVVRRPFDGAGVLAFLSARAIPGVEAATAGTYRRTLALGHGGGFLELALGRSRAVATVDVADGRDLPAVLAAARRLIDADADASEIAASLGADPLLAAPLRGRAGVRSPGAVDGAEIAIRAVVGQQVSVAAARTVLGRLAAAYGAPAAGGGLSRRFPSAAALAEVDPAALPMPRTRGRTVTGLAAALAGGRLSLEPDGDRDEARARLLTLPGIGPWTADYVVMRALGDPDVLLASDLGVRRAVEAAGGDGTPAAVARRGQAWAPFRSYATHLLWALRTAQPGRA